MLTMDLDWDVDCVSESIPKIADLVDPSIESSFLETVRLAALCERDEKAATSLRLTNNDLKNVLPEVQANKNRANNELQKLTDRFNTVDAELESIKIQKENLKSLLESLITDVNPLEQDKENRTEKLKTSFKTLVKTLKIYQNRLDVEVEALVGDIYAVKFSKGDRTTKLTLRSSDFKHWEVIDIIPKHSNIVEELHSYLNKTKDVIGVLCKVRKNALS